MATKPLNYATGAVLRKFLDVLCFYFMLFYAFWTVQRHKDGNFKGAEIKLDGISNYF